MSGQPESWTLELDAVPDQMEWRIGSRIVTVRKTGDLTGGPRRWQGTVSVATNISLGAGCVDPDGIVRYLQHDGESVEDVAKVVLGAARQLALHDDELNTILKRRIGFIEEFNNPEPEQTQ